MLQTLQSCAERHPLQERGAHQGTPESTAETEQEAAALQPKQETAAKSRDCSKSKQLKLEQATELKQEAADLPAATALRLPVAQAKKGTNQGATRQPRAMKLKQEAAVLNPSTKGANRGATVDGPWHSAH